MDRVDGTPVRSNMIRRADELQRSAPMLRPLNMAADGLPLGVNSGFGQSLDPEVLRQARRGRNAAFEKIYRLYGGSCYNLALRIVGEPAVAEDIVQDVFLRVMASISKFRGDAPFGVWLKRMMVNSTIDVVRRNRRFDGKDPEDHFATMQAESGSPEARVDAWNLLMRLSPRERAVVVLHELEGYTHKELAVLFDQSESYSKSILSRSLKRIAEPNAAIGDSEEITDEGR